MTKVGTIHTTDVRLPDCLRHIDRAGSWGRVTA